MKGTGIFIGGHVKGNSCLSSYTEINSKWTKEVIGRPGTLKLTEEKVGQTLWYIGLGKSPVSGTENNYLGNNVNNQQMGNHEF